MLLLLYTSGFGFSQEVTRPFDPPDDSGPQGPGLGVPWRSVVLTPQTNVLTISNKKTPTCYRLSVFWVSRVKGKRRLRLTGSRCLELPRVPYTHLWSCRLFLHDFLSFSFFYFSNQKKMAGDPSSQSPMGLIPEMYHQIIRFFFSFSLYLFPPPISSFVVIVLCMHVTSLVVSYSLDESLYYGST